MLCFSSSLLIYSDLKYIVYVYMNAVEHCGLPYKREKEILQIRESFHNFFLYSIAPLWHNPLWLWWQFSNAWHHNFRKEDRKKTEMLDQKTLHIYNLRWVSYLFSWGHSHVLYKWIHFSFPKVLKTCINVSALW